MEAHNAILIARDESLADEIQAELSQRTGRTVTICSYDNCRRQIAWHLKGILVLVANDETDFEPLTAVVREHKLRRSNRRIIVLEAGAMANTAAVTPLGSMVSTSLRWPEAADELAKLIGPRSSGDDQGESLSDVLGNKLRALTPSLAPMAGRLAVAAMHDVMVLLTGETGTGKTYLAHLLHEHSPRCNERFMIVPCGAQPAELFESTFFGHVKGSFTGAHQTQPGKFACAGKGTILLDEVDSLGFEQQAALLRVIETGEYEMVGSSQTLKSEARLIVASNTNLEDAVQKGLFRQDLFYRLNVMAFHLLPLRARPGDISLLAGGFAAQFAAKFGKPVRDITPEAIQALSGFAWSGNIRQLENAIQQAVLVCEGSELTLNDLPEEVLRSTSIGRADPMPRPSYTTNGHTNGVGTPAVGSLLRNRAEYERSLIQQTLEACQNNRSSAARALGVSRVTLHKKIKQYQL